MKFLSVIFISSMLFTSFNICGADQPKAKRAKTTQSTEIRIKKLLTQVRKENQTLSDKITYSLSQNIPSSLPISDNKLIKKGRQESETNLEIEGLIQHFDGLMHERDLLNRKLSFLKQKKSKQKKQGLKDAQDEILKLEADLLSLKDENKNLKEENEKLKAQYYLDQGKILSLENKIISLYTRLGV